MIETFALPTGDLFQNVATLIGETHVSSHFRTVKFAPLSRGSFTTADAGFVAASTNDFRLVGSSPLIDRGDSAPISVASTGVTVSRAPAGSPYLDVPSVDMAPGQALALTLRFDDPSIVPVRYVPRVLSGVGPR